MNKLYPLSFIELHNSLLMQGTTLGNRINAAQRGAKLLLDDERQGVWIHFKGKVSFIPAAAVASADLTEIPEDIQAALRVPAMNALPPEPSGPPAVRRGKKAKMDPEIPAGDSLPVEVPVPDFDPNDAEAAARHRALVRAASANAHRAVPTGPQNDTLIQQARMQAMGIKTHGTAQVMNAQQVGEMTGATVTGKPKPISHAALNAQKAKG